MFDIKDNPLLDYHQYQYSDPKEYRNKQINHVTEEHRGEVNILLIGCTGAGKSTLGNFLSGKTKFPISYSMERGNSTTESVEFFVQKKKPIFRIFDAPGLCDVEDLPHIMGMWRVIRHKRINLVILCLPWGVKSNNTDTIHMLQYYRSLLRPVVDAGNLIVVLTQVRIGIYRQLEMYDPRRNMTGLKAMESDVKAFVGEHLGTVKVVEMMDIKRSMSDGEKGNILGNYSKTIRNYTKNCNKNQILARNGWKNISARWNLKNNS